jgi:hypothetical protein
MAVRMPLLHLYLHLCLHLYLYLYLHLCLALPLPQSQFRQAQAEAEAQTQEEGAAPGAPTLLASLTLTWRARTPSSQALYAYTPVHALA